MPLFAALSLVLTAVLLLAAGLLLASGAGVAFAQSALSALVAAALVLLDREEGGRQAIEERGIPVYPLYTRTSLLGR